jgi:hypothetical protein
MYLQICCGDKCGVVAVLQGFSRDDRQTPGSNQGNEPWVQLRNTNERSPLHNRDNK